MSQARTISTRIGVLADSAELRARLTRALGGHGMTVSQSLSSDDLPGGTARLDILVIAFADDGDATLTAVRTAAEAQPAPRIVAVWTDRGEGRRPLRAGARGVVDASDIETTLAATVGAVASGLICIPRHLRAGLESEALSMREKQVLGLVVSGSSNADIAAKLFLAESTVKSHLSTAYAKLGVRSRKDAATRILDPVEGLGPGILAISSAA